MLCIYCNDIELRHPMERHERGEARVIPVILRDSDWTSSPFAKLQALPGEGRTIISFRNRDAAFLEVVRGIRLVAEELAKRPELNGSVALEVPEGPVRIDSPIYIHPADGARCCAELVKPRALIRIKAPRASTNRA
jgi:hypothetical protein